MPLQEPQRVPLREPQPVSLLESQRVLWLVPLLPRRGRSFRASGSSDLMLNDLHRQVIDYA